MLNVNMAKTIKLFRNVVNGKMDYTIYPSSTKENHFTEDSISIEVTPLTGSSDYDIPVISSHNTKILITMNRYVFTLKELSILDSCGNEVDIICDSQKSDLVGLDRFVEDVKSFIESEKNFFKFLSRGLFTKYFDEDGNEPQEDDELINKHIYLYSNLVSCKTRETITFYVGGTAYEYTTKSGKEPWFDGNYVMKFGCSSESFLDKKGITIFDGDDNHIDNQWDIHISKVLNYDNLDKINNAMLSYALL